MSFTINVTPDKSIYAKLGKSGYTVPQALAELIDNAIDARIDGWSGHVAIKIGHDQISIADKGSWMDAKQIANAITLAKSDKKGKLGEFGLGLKTACLSLGSKFTIISKKLGESKEYSVEFDSAKWEASAEWNLVIEETEKPEVEHYTIVVISKLFNGNAVASSVSNVRNDIKTRFGYYLGPVTITVNDERIFAEEPTLLPGTRREIDIDTPYGKVTGWAALLLEWSQKGYYGFHTFRRNRLIVPFNKFGFKAHPTVARMYGEIHLDFVPVTHNKKAFEVESEEYIDAEALVGHEIQPLLALAKKKQADSTLTKEVLTGTELWSKKAASAVRTVTQKAPATTVRTTLPEKRYEAKPGESFFDVLLNEKDFEEAKKSAGWEKVLHIDFHGQDLSFVHAFGHLGADAGPKSWEYASSAKRLSIISNEDYPTHYVCGDLSFLALINIAESLTEFLLKDTPNENSVKDYKAMFNSIVRTASELKGELI